MAVSHISHIYHIYHMYITCMGVTTYILYRSIISLHLVKMPIFSHFRQSPRAESFNRKRKADWFAGLSIDTCHVCGYSYTTHGNQFPPQSLFQSCAHTQNGSQADKRIIFKKEKDRNLPWQSRPLFHFKLSYLTSRRDSTQF